MKRLLSLGLVTAFATAATAGPASAQGLSLIRDSEIENTIRALAEPVFAAAGLNTDSVEVHLVNDPTLNAFVAGGQQIFINTGMILNADHPGQVSGVIAHEAGHIAGGHLARAQEALRNATAQSILAAVLGAAAVVAAGGNAGVGGAAIVGGVSVGQRSILQYSRIQESAADQAAIRYLEASGQSGRGLVEILEKLGNQTALLRSSQGVYARSHPLSQNRVAALRRDVEASRFAAVQASAEQVVAFDRMKAKLQGYLGRYAVTLRMYPKSDTSLVAHYARAFAYHRRPDVKQALAEAGILLDLMPDDPYFNELRGQILFENGRVAEAVPPYERAVLLAPGEPLLRIGLARAQIALNDPARNREAIEHLERAVRIDRTIISAWHQLAIAYGRDKQFGLSSLASAERAFLSGRIDEARGHAARAEAVLPVGSPGALRAQDILTVARKDGEAADRSRNRRSR